MPQGNGVARCKQHYRDDDMMIVDVFNGQVRGPEPQLRACSAHVQDLATGAVLLLLQAVMLLLQAHQACHGTACVPTLVPQTWPFDKPAKQVRWGAHRSGQGCAGRRQLSQTHALLGAGPAAASARSVAPAARCLRCLQAIDVVRELPKGTGDGAYLEAVRGALAEAFERCQPPPDLLLFNAGTDVLEGERARPLRRAARGTAGRLPRELRTSGSVAC